MTDKTREDFEVWAMHAGWPHYCVNADGGYFCSSSSWEPWQAATQHSAPRIAELEAEVLALRMDAERYRWLRDENSDKGTVGIRIAKNLYGMEWDAAIDAAMAQGEKP